MSVGKIIQKERKRLGLSQIDLAKILRIHRVTLGRYEKDESLPDTTTIIKMLDIFGISANTFLERNDTMVSEEKEVCFIKELKREEELYKEAMDYPKLVVEKLKNLY